MTINSITTRRNNENIYIGIKLLSKNKMKQNAGTKFEVF